MIIDACSVTVDKINEAIKRHSGTNPPHPARSSVNSELFFSTSVNPDWVSQWWSIRKYIWKHT